MKHKSFWLIYILLLGLALIRIIPFIFPESRTWGFNHLIFLPNEYSIAFFLLSAFALILPFFEFSNKYGQIFLTLFSTYFFEHRYKYLFRLVFIAVMAGLFITFTAPTHFLGDGYAQLSNVGSETGTIFPWTEWGALQVPFWLKNRTGVTGEVGALIAFRILSYIAGVIAIWFFFKLAEIISNDKIKRLLIFITCFFTGSLLLFGGYVESYPLVWIGLTGFIYFGLRYYKLGKGLIWSFLFLAFGTFIHLQMAVLIPAFIYLLFSRGIGFSIYNRYRKLLWSLLTIIICCGIILFIHLFKTNLYFEHMFLPILAGKPSSPEYLLLSLPHLLDIFNELLLLSPLLPLFLVLSFNRLREIISDKKLIFLAIASIGCLLFLLIIDPKLSMPRDWDLFSISTFGLMLILIILLPDIKTSLPKIFILSVTAFLILFSCPFLLANLNENTSIKYAKYVIDIDPQKSYSSLNVLKIYYNKIGDSLKSDSIRSIYINKFPTRVNIELAINALSIGEYELADRLDQFIKPDRFSTYYHHYLALLAIHKEKSYELALKELNIATRLSKYHSQIFTNRAQVLVQLGRFEEAIDDLNWSYNLDNANGQTLEGLTLAYFYINKPDSTIFFANKILNIDSLNPTAFYYLAESYYKNGEYDKALFNAKRYQTNGSRDLIYSTRMQRLSELFTPDNQP